MKLFSVLKLRHFAAAPLMALGLTAACTAQAADNDLYERVDRITWGATPQALAQAQKMGFDAWLEAQLHPAATAKLPAKVNDYITGLSISQRPSAAFATEQRNKQRELRKAPDNQDTFNQRRDINRANRARAQESAERATWLALYSPNQLQEQMTWFWMNHFSIWANKGLVSVFVDDYENSGIRPRSLGKFRDLLEASLRSPAMLLYLDNNNNRAGKINENYARELMELHTLGVDGGYTQHDVQELARILTGVTLFFGDKPLRVKGEHAKDVVQDGIFAFNPAAHDYGDKEFLGHHIKGRGWAEVEEAMDILARSPATARHISTKLAIYFVGDQPPQALIDQLTNTYLKSDGDMAAILRTLFNSPAFAASLKDGKFKDPVHYVYSALRLALHDQEPLVNAKGVNRMIASMGQAHYGRLTPDGYPLTQKDWAGSGQMNARFEAARLIAANPGAFYREDKDQPAPRLKLSRLETAYGKNSPFAAWPKTEREAITQARSVPDSNTYLLAAPSFMRR